jgi:hypothetical protein
MKALIAVDVQNELSPQGRRPVPNHTAALAAIRERVEEARREARPIAWVLHHNRPHEWPAFAPGSWGAELSPSFGPQPGAGPLAGTVLGLYLAHFGVALLVGFLGDLLPPGLDVHLDLRILAFTLGISPDSLRARLKGSLTSGEE